MGFQDRFWDIACEYRGLMKIALGINGALFGLLLLAIPGIEPGTGSYVIFVVDVVVLILLLGVTIYLLWRCERRVTEDQF